MSSEIIKSQLDVYRENFIENSDSPLEPTKIMKQQFMNALIK